MGRPEGRLTPAQHEIMEIVWRTGEAGATVTEIWTAIAGSREVARTTVLNLVDRLEKRGWLKRRKRRAPSLSSHRPQRGGRPRAGRGICG